MKHNQEAAGCQSRCCLQIKNLSVVAEGQHLLENVSLHMHCGEIVAVIGPNGAGKSTLLKAVIGQLGHTGDVLFDQPGGRDSRPLIGYVPQTPSFDRGDPFSVMDMFVSCASRYPVMLPPPKRLRRQAEEQLSLVDALPLIDQRVGSLSGGELQRVLLALALTPVPHVLVLDEPLSGVDAAGIETLFSILDELRGRFDLSILLTTHDFEPLRRFADYVALLNRSILDFGTPEAVFSGEAFCGIFGGSR